MSRMISSHKKIRKPQLKVAIGPVFNVFGGVSQHIFGIKKYSAHIINVKPSKFSRTIFRIGKLQRWFYKPFMNKVRINKYDVVHSHVDPWFTNLCLASRTDTCKWVHTYHMLYFEEDFSGGLKPDQEAMNRHLIEVASKADIKISVSKWLHDYLLYNYSISTEVIPNGIDLEICDKANPNRFIKKYGITDFVLFTGSIYPRKNPQLFVKLAAQMPEVRFVMIGRSLDVNRLINEYNVTIPKNLISMGELRYEDVLDAVAACKVFIMTSKREGLPTALLEAMGLGKPAVAPNHSGCKEVVHSNDYGFLYEPDSLDDLVEQTKRAFVSRHIGEKARERISRNYDWKILARRIDSLYESI